MRYLALAEALELHHRLSETSGGTHGLRDLGLLESALAQPRLTFDGEELYSDAFAKAAALAFSLIQNHVFLDGNTRVGHAAMETFLMLDGYQIAAHVDEQEGIVLAVASGLCSRAELTDCCGASACSLAAGEHTAPGPDLAAQTDRSVHSPINGSTPPGQLAHPASRAVRDDIGWGTLQWTIYAPGTHGRCRTPDFGATPRVVAAHAD